jgi:hypothetical protein
MYQRASLCDGCPPGVLWDRTKAEASVQKLITMDKAGDTILVNHDPGQWQDVADVQSLHKES